MNSVWCLCCRRAGSQHSPRGQADLCLRGNLLALEDHLYQQGRQDRGHPESQSTIPVNSALAQLRPCLIRPAQLNALIKKRKGGGKKKRKKLLMGKEIIGGIIIRRLQEAKLNRASNFTLAPSLPAAPGRPCSPGGPGGPGWPRSPIGPVSPVGPYTGTQDINNDVCGHNGGGGLEEKMKMEKAASWGFSKLKMRRDSISIRGEGRI